MIIKRVSVEGGLLAGLSQDIPAGLTVLIGGRGTGKTSVVEIIRYCTNTGSIASISDNKRTQQALSILGDGSVTVDFETSGAERSITMPGEEDSLAFLGAHRPLVFSQTEIESIGLDSASRLNLIDDFIPDMNELRAEEADLAGAIRNFSAELTDLKSKKRVLCEDLEEFSGLNQKIALLISRQEEQSNSSEQIASYSTKISEIQSGLKTLRHDQTKNENSIEFFEVVHNDLDDIKERLKDHIQEETEDKNHLGNL